MTVRLEGFFLTLCVHLKLGGAVFGLHFDRVRVEGFFSTLYVHLKLGGAVFGLHFDRVRVEGFFSTLYVHLKLGGAVFGLHFDRVRVEAQTSPSSWYMFVSPGARSPTLHLVWMPATKHAC